MQTELNPAGCNQQGRYATRKSARHEHWADAEWRDTVSVTRRADVSATSEDTPFSSGDFAMAVAIVAAICWIVSLGPWL
jgi:hypothetical protein